MSCPSACEQGTEFCVAPGLLFLAFHQSMVNYSQMCLYDPRIFRTAAQNILDHPPPPTADAAPLTADAARPMGSPAAGAAPSTTDVAPLMGAMMSGRSPLRSVALLLAFTLVGASLFEQHTLMSAEVSGLDLT